MDPVSLILGAASIGGGLLSSAGGRQTIDPNWLKQHFGAQALTQEFQDLFNTIINSPYGQNLMTQAAEQGQQFARDLAVRSGQAGFGPGGGANSGGSIFATSASEGAVGSLQRGVKSDIAAQALPIAQQLIQNRMAAAVQSKMLEQQTPTSLQNIGSTVGQAASAALLNREPRTEQTTPQTGPALPTMGQEGFQYPRVNAPSAAQGAMQSSGRGSFSRLGRGLGRFSSRFGGFVSSPRPQYSGV